MKDILILSAIYLLLKTLNMFEYKNRISHYINVEKLQVPTSAYLIRWARATSGKTLSLAAAPANCKFFHIKNMHLLKIFN